MLPGLSWRFGDTQVGEFLGLAVSKILAATAQALDAGDDLPEPLVRSATELARHAIAHGSGAAGSRAEDGPGPAGRAG